MVYFYLLLFLLLLFFIRVDLIKMQQKVYFACRFCLLSLNSEGCLKEGIFAPSIERVREVSDEKKNTIN